MAVDAAAVQTDKFLTKKTKTSWSSINWESPSLGPGRGDGPEIRTSLSLCLSRCGSAVGPSASRPQTLREMFAANGN